MLHRFLRRLVGSRSFAKDCNNNIHKYQAYSNVAYFEDINGTVMLLSQRTCILCNHIESTLQTVARPCSYQRDKITAHLNETIGNTIGEVQERL